MRYRSNGIKQRPNGREPTREDYIGTGRDDLYSKAANAGGVAGCPARIDAYVPANAPPQLLQPLHKRTMAHRCLRVITGECVEHSDAPHPLRLLRARRQRPRCGGGAEQRDELAASCMSGKQHSEG